LPEIVKGRVSVIIPGRCEPYFQQTVDSVLERATGDVEVVAVVDGPGQEPMVESDDPRVKIIVLDKSIGQRAGYNLGVRESSGEFVTKIDAHALFSEGFDEVLKANCPPGTTVLPEMRRLNVHTWSDKPRGRTHFMYFGMDLYCHYWNSYRHRPEAKAEYPEVMTGQGSCWFTTREFNDYIGLLDEGVGSWGNVGIEVSLRTWLCGGTQILNKKAWQAHWFRKDEGGFTYPMDGRQVAKAHNYTRQNYYYKDDAFEHQTRPFAWAIQKFEPVPGWEVYLADQFETKRRIIYYTDGHLDPGLMRACQKNLIKVTGQKIPIISVSQEPISFGNERIVVGEKPRCNRSIYEQILEGLKAAPEGSVIYLCEHDVAYAPAHFAHIPEVKDRIDYNQNRYYWAPGQTEYLPARGKWPLSGLVAYREYLMEQVEKALAKDEQPSTELYRGVRTHRFESERPNVDIRHGMNFSQDGRWKKLYYAGKSDLTVRNIGHWGSPPHMLKKFGWNPQPEMVSPLCRYLRRECGLQRFLPAPMRVPGFKRVDVSKIINLMGLKKGAEIGVAGGVHSETILRNIEGCELLCVDSWSPEWVSSLGRGVMHRLRTYGVDTAIPEGINEPDVLLADRLEAVARNRLEPYNVQFIKASSVEASLQVPDGSLDFVYIDAAHDFDSVMVDLVLWSPKVRKGGIIAGHDYDNRHKGSLVPAVNIYTQMHRVTEWFITDERKETSYIWMKPEA